MNPYDCYKDQNKIFEKKVYNKDFAYVYLLMKSTKAFEKYLIGTLVSAYALRKQDTKNKIVIMLTKDVDKKYYKIIRQVFDKIFIVNYFMVDDNFIKGIKSERWKVLYTKINLFRLIEYKKIVFINANLLPMRNCDYLFNYKAPGTTLLHMSFIDTFSNNNNKNREDSYIENNKMLCKSNTVGELEKNYKYKNMLKIGDKNYLATSSLFIFEPNMKVYDDIKNILTGKNKKYKNLSFENDEFFFSYYFRDKWTFIDLRFNSILFSKKYPYIEHIFILNYQLWKPFLLDKNNKFIDFPEYKLWIKYKKSMYKKYPKLREFIDCVP
jgi:alpha-N-acetylglucosamine transferase